LAEKVAKKLKLTEKTIIECNDYNIIEGDLDNPLWILKINGTLKVVLDVDEYMQMMDSLKTLMKENFELKLEKAILNEFPVDYDDVKAVVLEEMKRDENKSFEEIIHKVKLENPNLFYNVDLDKIF